MNKYEFKIFALIDETLIVLLLTFLYSDNEDVANEMADNFFSTYIDNSNYSEYYKGIVIQRSLIIVE